MLKFFNTITRKKEKFSPIEKGEVKIYTCGPTVYDNAHIGNLRSYVFADILCKTLKYSGFKVKQIINVTDVGHLRSDADAGEDKMTRGLLREGKSLTLENMRNMAEFYFQKFKEDLEKLNIQPPAKFPFASDYIKEIIALIKKIEENGYTYKTSDGIYFDISKFPEYGKLLFPRSDLGNMETKNKNRISENPEKINQEDFALWKFAKVCKSDLHYKSDLHTLGQTLAPLGFLSPWGLGFPGWHIECSAMGIKLLGKQFDIHTGGIDHVQIHHTNEIAQSEAATGKKPFVKFWMHHEFVDIGKEKMAKSAENFLKLDSIIEKKINPIAYRLWLLMAHYKTKMNFDWESLEGAEKGLQHLYQAYLDLNIKVGKSDLLNKSDLPILIKKNYQQKFIKYINDDLNTPKAIALLWSLIKNKKINNLDKKITILDFDKVLSLGFKNLDKIKKKEKIPEKIKKLIQAREKARQNRNFSEADLLRAKINSLGYEVKDTSAVAKL
jgi:cysteinyl-tRNA synthetase